MSKFCFDFFRFSPFFLCPSILVPLSAFFFRSENILNLENQKNSKIEPFALEDKPTKVIS